MFNYNLYFRATVGEKYVMVDGAGGHIINIR